MLYIFIVPPGYVVDQIVSLKSHTAYQYNHNRALCGPLFILFQEHVPLIMFSRGITAGNSFYAYLGMLQPRKMTVWYLTVIHLHYQTVILLSEHVWYLCIIIKVGCWKQDGWHIQRSIHHTWEASLLLGFVPQRKSWTAHMFAVCVGRASLPLDPLIDLLYAVVQRNIRATVREKNYARFPE